MTRLDALIVATAEAHGLAVVTRDREDFRGAGVPGSRSSWDRGE
ncbi:PIN domain-containing protein [Nocardia brasiliensis]